MSTFLESQRSWLLMSTFPERQVADCTVMLLKFGGADIFAGVGSPSYVKTFCYAALRSGIRARGSGNAVSRLLGHGSGIN